MAKKQKDPIVLNHEGKEYTDADLEKTKKHTLLLSISRMRIER